MIRPKNDEIYGLSFAEKLGKLAFRRGKMLKKGKKSGNFILKTWQPSELSQLEDSKGRGRHRKVKW